MFLIFNSSATDLVVVVAQTAEEAGECSCQQSYQQQCLELLNGFFTLAFDIKLALNQ